MAQQRGKRQIFRKDRAGPVPTPWCRNHKRRCKNLFEYRWARRFRDHDTGRTRITRTANRKMRYHYKRAWYRKYGDGCQQCTAAEQQQARGTATGAWRRFRRDVDCQINWYVEGGEFMCHRIVTWGEWLDQGGREYLVCAGGVLGGHVYGKVAGKTPIGLGAGIATCTAGYAISRVLAKW